MSSIVYNMTDLRSSCDEMPVEWSVEFSSTDIYCRRVPTCTLMSTIQSVWCPVGFEVYKLLGAPPPSPTLFSEPPFQLSKNFRSPPQYLHPPLSYYMNFPLLWHKIYQIEASRSSLRSLYTHLIILEGSCFGTDWQCCATGWFSRVRNLYSLRILIVKRNITNY